MNRFTKHVVLLALLCAFFAQGMANTRHASLTFDEGPHLAVGYATLRTGDFRLQPVHIHPPLANMIAAAPLLLQNDLPDPTTINGWHINSLSSITDNIIWKYPYPARLATAGRTPILLLGVLLAAIVYSWTKLLGGQLAAIIALLFFVFDPNLIVHSSLITTDLAITLFSTATLFTTFLYLFPRQNSTRQSIYLIFAGLLLGLSQLSKVSALVLLPVIGLAILIKELAFRREILPSLFTSTRVLLVLVSIAFIALWAGYGFTFTQPAGFDFAFPAGTHWEIYQSLAEHYQLGHPTFAAGKINTQGWWWYFPLAFIIKTPLPALIATGLSFTLIFINLLTSPLRTNLLKQSRTLLLAGWLILYAFSSLFSSVNIGYRHLLPILPGLYILTGCTLAIIWQKFNRFTKPFHKTMTLILPGIFALLMGWLLWGTLSNFGAPLEFFNELAGGKVNGYQYLVDSNLDWGQNLWDLRHWMDESHVNQVKYAHYSPATPAQYGVNAAFLPPDPRAAAFTPWDPESGIYVLGATVLQGVYTPDINTYAYFRSQKPLTRLGGALFVFEIENHPSPTWVVSCDPEPAQDRIQQALSTPPTTKLRILYPDCQNAQIYPSLSSPGYFIAPTGFVPPHTAQHAFDLKNSDGSIWRTIYRIENPPEPQNIVDQSVYIEGPLHFLGFSLENTPIEPGSTLLLETYWQVSSVPDRPLSILAQLVIQDGPALSVGDGMGFPIEQWSAGDIIIQTHRLTLPGTLPGNQPLKIITGGYWLDTMERWSTGLQDNVIVLSEINAVKQQD